MPSSTAHWGMHAWQAQAAWVHKPFTAQSRTRVKAQPIRVRGAGLGRTCHAFPLTRTSDGGVRHFPSLRPATLFLLAELSGPSFPAVSKIKDDALLLASSFTACSVGFDARHTFLAIRTSDGGVRHSPTFAHPSTFSTLHENPDTFGRI